MLCKLILPHTAVISGIYFDLFRRGLFLPSPLNQSHLICMCFNRRHYAFRSICLCVTFGSFLSLWPCLVRMRSYPYGYVSFGSFLSYDHVHSDRCTHMVMSHSDRCTHMVMSHSDGFHCSAYGIMIKCDILS